MTFVRSASAWVQTPEPRPNALLRLVCFHHAGGGASAFREWARCIQPQIEILAVQLPGREGRLTEPPACTPEEVLISVIPELRQRVGGAYALFGHSMGGGLAYALAERIRRTNELPQPRRLFISASRPPTRHGSSRPQSRQLSDEDLIDRLVVLGGTPKAVLADRELLKMFLPALRADFELAAQARAAEGPLSMPITVLGGWDDRTVKPDQLEGWKALTTCEAQFRLLPGGHFYHHKRSNEVLRIIEAALASDLFPATVVGREPIGWLS